jgi:hypothetical protein
MVSTRARYLELRDAQLDFPVELRNSTFLI